ncbi:MAG: DUF502 domain-containing protein [Deltaproteobacteria bacterium]|nr:DUF502 domain-containing protein [Deltaproteobacteria bacterium]
MKKLTEIFLRGLFTLLPIIITFYVLSSGINILENILGHFLKSQLNDNYIPGLGFTLALLIIFLFGLLITSFITKSIWEQIEVRLTRVPLIKALYSPLKDLMGLFSNTGKKDLKSVVSIEISPGVQMVGLVTRDQFEDIPEIAKANPQMNLIAVFIPLSYALGGYTVLVEKNRVTKMDIPVEKALSLAITGWVKAHNEPAK